MVVQSCPYCEYEWDYRGDKSEGERISCPDCKRKFRLESLSVEDIVEEQKRIADDVDALHARFDELEEQLDEVEENSEVAVGHAADLKQKVSDVMAKVDKIGDGVQRLVKRIGKD